MRLSKIVGIAGIAAFALVAFIGAATASATRLCSTNTNPCTAWYANDSTLTSHLSPSTAATLTTSGGSAQPTITCNSSTVGLTNTNVGGGTGVAVTGKLNALSFTNCSSINPTGCSSTAAVGSLASTSWVVNWTAATRGTLQVRPPLVGFTCVIVGLQVNCTFGGSGTIDSTVTGGAPGAARLDVVNQNVAAIGGFGCPMGAIWNAQYTTTFPLSVTPT